MDRSTIEAAVTEAVIEALGAEPEEVVPDATLLDALGAESIDLLDILFRLERSLGIKIQAAELAAYVQGGIPDEEFGDENEIVSAAGLAQLKKVMPQIDTAALAGKLEATKVMGLFTVENLVGLVEHRAALTTA
ncbi:acyl carrier protein [Streptomyces pactum]|uniref:Acyl carrier protein n=1 Tax=Streptomyces pactum TaxID=68249 RepID=A0ABS0NT69_9ACTN|nr:acyl carrier protein [Streptomyces pactum]MBH5338409.1 acyl carrier protein [Streptomyces pactum]